MRKVIRFLVRLGVYAAVFLLMAGVGSMAYFHFAPPGKSCLSCHEMTSAHGQWASSAHRSIHCRECHGGSLTLNVHSLESHVRRAVGHLKSQPAPPDIRLSHDHVVAMNQRCRSCHQSEYAAWASGGHSVAYNMIFLNPAQNRAEQLGADCLRCHGMLYGGTIEQLVSPIDNKGPWRLTEESMRTQPAIPCMACHGIHRAGEPLKTAALAASTQSAGRPTTRPARAGFHDRHEAMVISAENLPVPIALSEGRPLRASSDVRQRICMQCHATNAFHQAGTADDRTPRGVHEGLSCLACHQPHSNEARSSCATCHPAISNCKLDVSTMDTSFRSPNSAHDIHTVACGDCHGGRRPEKRPGRQPALPLPAGNSPR